jgi:photosystem II stability/assembly factor-like uncharacterized protein
MRAVFPALLVFLLPLAHAEDRWKIQFSYDKVDALFDIRDLACPSAQRCVAAGVISDRKGRDKGAIVVTSDGGQHWSQDDFAEQPISLFMPSETSTKETTGWMVTDRGIWTTQEGGRSWQKLAALKGIVQVYFLDPTHGFAIGYPKAIYETNDGGKQWSKVPAALVPASKPEDTIYDCIAFNGQQGVIIGQVITDQYQRYPVWMTSDAARVRQQKQAPAIMLQTLDGGKTWKSSVSTIVGNIGEMRFVDDANVLALVEYHDYYTLPSSIIKIKLGTPRSQVIFSERDRAITDIFLRPGGGALIAAVEPPGNTNQVPIPGKLRMLRSANLTLWEEMDVDYRAEAKRATLAAPDAQHAWVATDTGMILALESKSAR